MARNADPSYLIRVAEACRFRWKRDGNIIIVHGEQWIPHRNNAQAFLIMRTMKINLLHRSDGYAVLGHKNWTMSHKVEDTPGRVRFGICDMAIWIHARLNHDYQD